MEAKGKLDIIATLKTESNLEVIRIVDFLNKNLKEKGLVFGVSQNGDKMIISVYET